MRIRRNDTEEYNPDESSVIEHYLREGTSFSMSRLKVDGTHRNESKAEIAYYVLEGDGHIHVGDEIIDMEEKDVVYAKEESHTLEGEMELLVVRKPPVESKDQDL
ncbi:MAG: hypothetical protein MUP58_00040 [Candidatus Nanohaloarchaeota archaeon QJJ-9]|nr:hypothetical protein [Candidatus Nanohaloarchaeota archaeon QJJ-9]